MLLKRLDQSTIQQGFAEVIRWFTTEIDSLQPQSLSEQNDSPEPAQLQLR